MVQRAYDFEENRAFCPKALPVLSITARAKTRLGRGSFILNRSCMCLYTLQDTPSIVSRLVEEAEEATTHGVVVERGQEYQRAIAQLQGLEAARQRLKEVGTQ